MGESFNFECETVPSDEQGAILYLTHNNRGIAIMATMASIVAKI